MAKRPACWVFALLAVLVVLPGLPLPLTLMAALEHITGLGLISATAGLVVLIIGVTGRFACWALPGRYRPHPSRAAVRIECAEHAQTDHNLDSQPYHGPTVAGPGKDSIG